MFEQLNQQKASFEWSLDPPQKKRKDLYCTIEGRKYCLWLMVQIRCTRICAAHYWGVEQHKILCSPEALAGVDGVGNCTEDPVFN